MQKAGKLLYEGFVTALDGFWVVWLSDLLWVAFLLPVLTAPLGFAGLYECADGLVRGESVTWRTFFTGIKRHLGASLRWALFNLAALISLGFYVGFLSPSARNLTGLFSSLLGAIPIILIVFWLCLNQFTFPFMLAQVKPSYLNALRNSLVLFVKWPGITVGFVTFNLLVMALSTLLAFPWLLFGASLPALMACLFVKYTVDQTLGTRNTLTENM